MRRISLVAYLVLFALVMPVFAQQEPVAARKPLRFWVERLSHQDPKVRERAAEFVENKVESNWVLRIIALDPKERDKLEAFRKQAKPLIPELLKALDSTDETVVEAVAAVFMALGPEAQSALPELEHIVLDKQADFISRMFCSIALLHVTPKEKPVGPVLLKYLNSMPKETLQKLVVGVLVTFYDNEGEQPANSLISTIIAMSAPTFVISLASSGRTKIEVPSLVKIASGDFPSSIRALAIGTLGALSFDAKSAVPALRKLLKDEDRFIGTMAATSLIQIESNPKLVPMMVESLKLTGKDRETFEKEMRDYFELQELAIIIRRENFFDESEIYYIQQLKYGNGYLRRLAIHNLGLIGPNAKSAVPELRKLLKDPDEDTRRMAAEAIKQIEIEVVTSNGK